jgi:cell wall-associated NlpC family hydrolase
MFSTTSTALADDATPAGTGGAAFDVPPAQPTVPGAKAVVKDGVAYAPLDAPVEIQKAIWAGNEIQAKPYVYGGGHRSFKSTGYDCSGTVSYALHGGGLLETPLDSGSFMSWGEKGRGLWITVYTNPGHAYVYIAGLRLDTSGTGGRGPRWRTAKRSNRGFKARHPLGF